MTEDDNITRFARGAATSRSEAVEALLKKARDHVLSGKEPEGVMVSACVGRAVCGTDGMDPCLACEFYEVDSAGVATRVHRA